jgi:protein SDA1
LVVSESNILGPRKKAKADYEDRIGSIARGREGREIFVSLKGKQKETASSSTNREKARNKPIMMILGSKGVKGKKQSLREKQKRLRAHIERENKGHH